MFEVIRLAKEWYLLKPSYGTVSGFEGEGLATDSAQAFEDVLETEMAYDVEVCNYDLSVRFPCRAIVEGNSQDTKLNSIQRRFLVRIGTCETGQYFYYKDRYWLIVGFVDGEKFYDKAIAVLCNYYLTWVAADGEICQRWSNITSASQYNNGETTDKSLTFRTDQLLVLTPNDDKSIMIEHGERFIIDSRCKIYEKGFSDDTTADTSNPLLTYHLTRMDNVLYDYQDGGHSEFMAYQDEKHEGDGYYVINGNGYWLCEFDRINSDKTTLLSGKICCSEPVIYNSLEPAEFYAELESVSPPEWTIDCDFADRLSVYRNGDGIFIAADDRKLVGKSFNLNLILDGEVKDSITVFIKAF